MNAAESKQRSKQRSPAVPTQIKFFTLFSGCRIIVDDFS